MKITYKVFAHTSKEDTVDQFESACMKADHVPYDEDVMKAKFIGSEVEILVEFDTETRTFTWKS